MDARALTLRQPWASLVAVGAKTIIDQAKPTKYRGRLLIHAGAHRPRNEWFQWGGPPKHHPYDTVALGKYVEITESSDGDGNFHYRWTGPLGAVVASCQLVDSVPIVDSAGCNDRDSHLCVVNGSGLLHSPLSSPWPDGETEHIVSAQLPFGDFTPGRWAWLLDDVKPTTARCPRCCWSGAIRGVIRDGTTEKGCPTCHGAGVCDPVPMRGRPGLWRPEWETA